MSTPLISFTLSRVTLFSSFTRWLPLALITLVALWLRTHDLAARPMHSDEANQAVKFGELLEHGRYAFDPRDHHGPTLYYAALPIAWLRGQHALAALDETTLRLVPALAGTAAVVLLYFLALPLGAWPAAAAAAFLAVSPPAVYYSRYFVQETLLATFALAAFVSARQWWVTKKLGWAAALGVSVGFMQATKASAPLFLVAAALALFACRGTLAPENRFAPRQVSLILLCALFTSAVFYSSFGTHLAGLNDAIATYQLTGARVGSGLTGHEKPWWYYLRLFTWQREGGLVFQQLAFSLLALAGAVAAFVTSNKLLRWAACYTAIVALFLSFPAYKTPWHAIHLVPGLALLAAGALASLCVPRSFRLCPAIACAVIALCFLFRQTQLTAFLRPADPRNPYAYVHSSPDVLKYRPLAEAALARSRGQPVRVIGEEYWPLPWYFRGLEKNIGYWPAPPADCDGALVIATEHTAADVRARLHGTYGESILGLRPGVLCVVFTRSP